MSTAVIFIDSDLVILPTQGRENKARARILADGSDSIESRFLSNELRQLAHGHGLERRAHAEAPDLAAVSSQRAGRQLLHRTAADAALAVAHAAAGDAF